MGPKKLRLITLGLALESGKDPDAGQDFRQEEKR